ncbi:hypothetical protein GCM10023144_15150 [Pigmentiphaga soli]|uniref:Porin n=1 Tax=Pigmentiphaga soli TaxID=1007095 RepID=A0ABP8GRI3_9BURK
MIFRRFGGACLALACAAPWLPASAQGDDAGERFALHAQSTYVWQRKPSMDAAYDGPNSLGAPSARSYSFTATIDVGARLWQGAEFHFNGEGARGAALSGLHGMGGLSNGELAKTAGSDLTLYRARAFVRQTWGLGGATQDVDADMNQLAGTVDTRRLVLTAGNLSVLDVFDGVEASHDPRTQFLNWSFMTYGAFDYAADARGYTWGASLEYIGDGWAVRAGRFMQPRESNGTELDTHLGRHYGDQVEFQKDYTLFGRAGTARVLAFRNHARMGSFDDAIAAAQGGGGAPDLATVRAEHSKSGFGFGFEQAVGAGASVFLRASRADGKTETYAFTEIDRALAAGLALDGGAWSRPGDTAGLALALNGLSSAHREYLRRGGLGAFLGDGGLSYGSERIVEGYYSWRPLKRLWLTADAQFVRNPGYNRDRGPAKVFSLRVHTEF